MQLPHYEMGIWAVEHLLADLEAAGSQEAGVTAAPPQALLPCPLVLRNSV